MVIKGDTRSLDNGLYNPYVTPMNSYTTLYMDSPTSPLYGQLGLRGNLAGAK